MKPHKKICIALLAISALTFSCATSSDMKRLEDKVDKLIQATNRSTLEEIFGVESEEISKRINNLNENQQARFMDLQNNYTKGQMPIKEVREKMINILGNNHREVATQRGIYIRDNMGIKLSAISNGTKIMNCRLIPDTDVPELIKNNNILQNFTWGQGEINHQKILFPWELTMSTFTKEIVQNVARRTANEFIKMGGDKKWNKPVYIQVSVEGDDELKIMTKEGENEVYVVTKKETEKKNEVAVEPHQQ